MPSSPGYKRDYKQEARTSKARGEIDGGHNTPNAERKRMRRQLQKEGRVHPHDGKDVDHINPLSKGGSNAESNARVVSEHKNRSYPRNPDGSMKIRRSK